jgi:hypothetical protein
LVRGDVVPPLAAEAGEVAQGPGESATVLAEIRMLLALGQQPDLLLYWRGQCVGRCENVKVVIDGTHLRVSRAEWLMAGAPMVDSVRLQTPSGAGFNTPFSYPTRVGPGDNITASAALPAFRAQEGAN